MVPGQTVFTPENVPGSLIGLDTPAGAELLAHASVKNQRVIDNFVDQVSYVTCGPVSLVILINAMNVALRIKYSAANQRYGFDKSERYTDKLMKEIEAGNEVKVNEDEIMSYPALLEYFKKVNIYERGLGLEQLGTVADLLGFGSNRYYALCDGDKSALPSSVKLGGNIHVFNNKDEFRSFVISYLTRPVTGLVVNYDMSKIGYEGLPGHHSPLAAYHQETDRLLIMDVWPDTPSVWVKTDELYNAMCAIDSDTNAPRGLLHIHELL